MKYECLKDCAFFLTDSKGKRTGMISFRKGEKVSDKKHIDLIEGSRFFRKIDDSKKTKKKEKDK